MSSLLQSFLSSRKAWVVFLSLIAVAVLAGLGKVTSEEAINFFKFLVPAWLGAIAAEDVAAKLGGPKGPATTVSVEVPQAAPQTAMDDVTVKKLPETFMAGE